MDLSLANWIRKQRLVPPSTTLPVQQIESSGSAIRGHNNAPSAANAGPSTTEGILGGMGSLADALKKKKQSAQDATDFGPLWSEGDAGAPQPSMMDNLQSADWWKQGWNNSLLGGFMK